MKALSMQGFGPKRTDADHYGYPELGLTFLAQNRVPKVLNYLERGPESLMVSIVEVLNLVFINPKTSVDQWIPWNWRKCVCVCVCPGRSFVTFTRLSKGLLLRKRATAVQMLPIICRIAFSCTQHFGTQPKHPAPASTRARFTVGL